MTARKVNPEISIVIVNSDGLADTRRCLESILKNPPSRTYEIILVDNASNESPAVLREICSDFRLIETKEKQGFARNYNLGLQSASGRYRLILNNDTLVHSGAMDRLVGALERHPDCGFVGPKLVNADGSVQPVCARALPGPKSYILEQLLLDPGMPFGKLWHRFRARQVEHRETGPVPCLSGACMAVRKDALDEIGLLDESYLFYFEDVEWCYRAQAKGYINLYTADAVVTHLGDRSLSKVREIAKKNEYLSAQRYFQATLDRSPFRRAFIWLAMLAGVLLRYMGFRWVSRDPSADKLAVAYRSLFGWLLAPHQRWGRTRQGEPRIL